MLIVTQQIKAARALLGWGQFELAQRSKIAISTIRRLEGLNGAIAAHFETVTAIRRTLEDAGIEFFGPSCPGVRYNPNLTNGELTRIERNSLVSDAPHTKPRE
jgi:transcriptional regulator with XRE-family HTH domain